MLKRGRGRFKEEFERNFLSTNYFHDSFQGRFEIIKQTRGSRKNNKKNFNKVHKKN